MLNKINTNPPLSLLIPNPVISQAALKKQIKTKKNAYMLFSYFQENDCIAYHRAMSKILWPFNIACFKKSVTFIL